MSTRDHQHHRQERLLDSQITTVKADRRSFLSKAIGTGALMLGAVSTQGCSDPCDTDPTRADFDPFDPIQIGDACDRD